MTSDAAKLKIYVKAMFSLFSYLFDHISDCQFNKKTPPDKKNSKYFFVVYCVSRILVWSPFKALKGMKDLINLYSTFLIDFASQPFRRVYFKNGQHSIQNMMMIWSTEKQSTKQIECDP